MLLAIWAIAGVGPGMAESRNNCGFGVGDWCASYRGDPCNRHKTKESCMADRRCYGMLYRGIALIPCFNDNRGFSSNCPTVGCTSKRPRYKVREGFICLQC